METPETHLAARVREIKGSNLKQVILSYGRRATGSA